MPRTDDNIITGKTAKGASKPSRYARKANGKKATGAPSKLEELKARPDFLSTVFQLARRGSQYKDVALALGVGLSTVESWARTDDEFLREYKRGKDEFDSGEVESALLKSARGYEYTETSVKTLMLKTKQKDADGKTKSIAHPAEEVTVAHKKMAPSVGAIVFWLTNRQRERWQNTRYVKHDGKVDGPPAVVNNYQLTVEDVKELPQEDLENFARTLQQAADRKRQGTDEKSGPCGTA